jgi:hypothetical protein
MPEKQKPHDRKNAFAALAAFAMTLLLTLWNVFAAQDRSDIEGVSASGSTLQKDVVDACTPSSSTENLGTRCMPITRTRSS